MVDINVVHCYGMEANKQSLYLESVKFRTVLFSFLSVLIATSCEQRDPQAEYEILRDTKFASPQEGETAAQEYIDFFYDKKRARITEVSEIRDQYRKMDSFFSASSTSYADFMGKSHVLNKELSYSNYEGVRKMLLSRYEMERDRLLEPLLGGISVSDFDKFFQGEIVQLCKNEFNIWEIESIDCVSLSSPNRTNDRMAVRSFAEYRVHLKGGIVGLLTPTAVITIEGIAGPDKYGNLIFNRTGYQFTKKPIL